MIKMIVSDLDGTLLTKDNKVIEQDKKAIHAIINQGIHFSVATGRMDHEILEVLQMIGVNANRISQNGAYLYSEQGEMVANQTFQAILAQEIFNFLPHSEDTLVTISSENQAYVKEKNQILAEMESRLFFPVLEEPTLLDKLGKTIAPSKISVHAETNFLIEIEKEFKGKYGNQADSFISDPHCFDIMPKDISKGNTVTKLIKKLNISPDEIACIGDSFNDVSMFQLTPYSFAMSHADSKLKDYANYEVDHVYQVIDLLRKEGLLAEKQLMEKNN